MTDSITVTAPVSYKLFHVPDEAHIALPASTKQQGFVELPRIPLSEVPQQALDKMAEAWVRDLYKKAGKERPPGVC